ncbi:MAG TPA: methyltransferase domain-containing protein [Acidimicrobiales bacterium]|nr:methyltransferase domain-containing protein [Acidimicrobiales bacterium]
MTDGYALRLGEAERTRYRQMAAAARRDEAERWSRAGVVPGARVADVGCGPGAVLVELARLVGRDGRVIGVEPDPAARAAARQELDAAAVEWAEVVAGTGLATGLELEAWDCVMVRHVLIHTGDAAGRIVQHLADLLTPGGFLYLVDTDLDGVRTSPADPELEVQHRRYAEFHRSMGNDVRMGPRLPVLLTEAGGAVRADQAAVRPAPGRPDVDAAVHRRGPPSRMTGRSSHRPLSS